MKQSGNSRCKPHIGLQFSHKNEEHNSNTFDKKFQNSNRKVISTCLSFKRTYFPVGIAIKNIDDTRRTRWKWNNTYLPPLASINWRTDSKLNSLGWPIIIIVVVFLICCPSTLSLPPQEFFFEIRMAVFHHPDPCLCWIINITILFHFFSHDFGPAD